MSFGRRGAHSEMGRNCDFCGEKFPIDFGLESAIGDRLQIIIAAQKLVRPIRQSKGNTIVAYGPFTYYHAPWYIESRDHFEAKRTLRMKTEEDYEQYEQCDGYRLNSKKEYIPDDVYCRDFSPFGGCIILGEGTCLDCGLKYMPYFQEDGTPNEALRQHLQNHFWEDPGLTLSWYVDNQKVTRAEFFKVLAERQFAPEVTQ